MSELYYSLQTPGKYFDSLSLKKRLEMLDLFNTAFPANTFKSVLDVGVTPDKTALASNYLEKYFPEKDKITALSNLDASFLEEVYPGLKFQLGDACHLPFENNSQDIVFSSAVIEHVGNLDQQRKMLAECYRVARRGVFITTPNRWYPVEFHTVLPLLHWLPKPLHRRVLKAVGMDFFAEEKNLNLMDIFDFIRLCNELNITNYKIQKVKTFGFTSNLVLVINK